MFVKKAFAAILGIATLATGLSGPAHAAMWIPKPNVQEMAAPAPIQVRDHIRFGNEVILRNGTRYWNGHRGYRHFRDGYHRHRDGWWYPRSAFSFGIVIAPRPTYRYVERAIPGRLSPAHVDWCYDRYRSYRSYDNSWQPNYGSRRVCRSPYW